MASLYQLKSQMRMAKLTWCAWTHVGRIRWNTVILPRADLPLAVALNRVNLAVSPSATILLSSPSKTSLRRRRSDPKHLCDAVQMATTTAPIPHDGTAPAGALTTVFTPPADCANDIEDLWYKTRTCLPLSDRWRLYWEAASFYSPGICPSGMHSVASPPPFFGPPIEPGETAIVCCPTSVEP